MGTPGRRQGRKEQPVGDAPGLEIPGQCAFRTKMFPASEVGVQCEFNERAHQLEKEKDQLKQRLEFVEELIGPTEAQRKALQDQMVAARSAALRAKYRGANVPTKVAGRLDEELLCECGVSEREAGLLQGGCLPDTEGILQDVSLLGDPSFHPYDQLTGEPRWNSRGGMLQLSLDEVRNRFGNEIAYDVVRCAKELDKYDGSRRVGLELPWHASENRELEPAEVIDLMDRQLSSALYLEERDVAKAENLPVHISPYAVVNVPPRRGRARRGRGRTMVGVRNGRGRMASAGDAVVRLPRVDVSRRGCAMPGALRHRIQEFLDVPSPSCNERARLF